MLSRRATDVLVVAQKIVSKAEARVVDLPTVEPSARALKLAAEIDKDPRLVEIILSESVRIVRARRGVLIVEHKLGFIMANAGVDQSNVGPTHGAQRVLLLPEDPDASAEALRRGLAAKIGIDIAVVINDSFAVPAAREPSASRSASRVCPPRSICAGAPTCSAESRGQRHQSRRRGRGRNLAPRRARRMRRCPPSSLAV